MKKKEFYCQNCGTQVIQMEQCPECGRIPVLPIAPAETSVVCKRCLQSNHGRANYCFACGQQLKGSKSSKIATSVLSRSVESQAIEAIREFQQSRGGKMKINSNDKRVAVWGPQEVGKTAFVMALYLAARQDGANWYISLEKLEEEGRALLNEWMVQFISEGRFPPATQMKKDLDIYNLVFYPDDKNAQIQEPANKDLLAKFWDLMTKDLEIDNSGRPAGISLPFVDVAGERYLTESPNSDLWNYLAGCEGLICLLDPEKIDKHFNTLTRLGGLLKNKLNKEAPDQLLENGRYLPHRVSLCFSKMDREPWRKYLVGSSEGGKAIEELLKELQEKTVFSIRRELETYFSPGRISFHCISSIGIEAGYIPNDKTIQAPKKIKPINIFAPLNDWIKSRN